MCWEYVHGIFEDAILYSAISPTFTRRWKFFSSNDVMNNVKQEDGGYLRYQLEGSHQPYIWYDRRGRSSYHEISRGNSQSGEIHYNILNIVRQQGSNTGTLPLVNGVSYCHAFSSPSLACHQLPLSPPLSVTTTSALPPPTLPCYHPQFLALRRNVCNDIFHCSTANSATPYHIEM